MISGQAGNLAIYLAFGMAILSGAAFLFTAIGKRNLFNFAVKAYYVQIATLLLAVAYLWFLLFGHDFSIQYVYEYSSTDLPFFYLLSSLWAGQAGTYLLWLLLSSISGLIIIYRARQYRTWAMVFYSFINIFLLVMLVTLSPFKPFEFAASEGAGLNPLLQDFWMVIHPPVVFVAFAVAGVPFAIVLAALVRRDFSGWLNLCFPYVVITSLAFAVANVLGGYWAYKTLGWGGYWAWDPVENTSFIPWVISLGLIHGLLIEKRSGALRKSNILLTALLFILVVYGTFLTRSGVLADFSVHSFVDLGVNAVLISFLIFFVILTLAIFAFSRSAEKTGKPLNYNIFSRDFMLFVGMALLSALGLIVLFWSSLPLLTKYLSSTPAAAEVSTYNSFAFPFVVVISLFLTISPLITGSGFALNRLGMKALTAFLISLVISAGLLLAKMVSPVMAVAIVVYLTVILIYLRNSVVAPRLILSLLMGAAGLIISLISGVTGVENLFFIGAAIAAAAAQVSNLIQLFPHKPGLVGGHLTHFGFGIMLVGILASSVFTTNKKVVILRGQSAMAYEHTITYNGMSGSLTDNNNEILLTLEKGGSKREAFPQFFQNVRGEGMMKRPYIRKYLTYDLYLSPQDIQELAESQGLLLKKGESKMIGDFKITFIGFDISPHSTSSTMSVGAKLEVEYGGKKEFVTPRMVSDTAGIGKGLISPPTGLFSGTDYRIVLERVFAGQGEVILSIPGLAEAGPPDQLILDVSVKPAINLLWLGSLIVFAGLILSVSRRLKR